MMNIKKLPKYLIRNFRDGKGHWARRNEVNLFYWDYKPNVGDALAPVIYEWMLDRKGLSANTQTKGTKHLLTVGSILGLSDQDATVWGSGIHLLSSVIKLTTERNIRKLDIRAVRGPVTARILKDIGYEVPKVYGDPAILMPLIYQPQNANKKYRYSVICHMHTQIGCRENEDIHYIDIKTTDYKRVIDEIVMSEHIISSSLHGIILAEAYRVPAVMLCSGVEDELLKYYDWYYSTGRKMIPMVSSINEGRERESMYEMPPVFEEMQDKLIKAFPYDLFN